MQETRFKKKTMQRNLHKCHYKFSNIRKRIILKQTQKNARKEQCKNWLKENVIFSKIVLTDEKIFRLDEPQNCFSFHGQHNKI